MKWYKKLHRQLKEVWDRELRPQLEPVIRLVIGQKITKEVNRHVDK